MTSRKLNEIVSDLKKEVLYLANKRVINSAQESIANTVRLVGELEALEFVDVTPLYSDSLDEFSV